MGHGVDGKMNEETGILKKDFAKNVREVNRVLESMMSLKLEIEGVMHGECCQ